MKIVTVIGARPQFIKAAAVSHVLRESPSLREILVHTGQHYDENMSAVFFEELGIPHPEVHLGVGSGLHGAQTARMLEGIERVLVEEKPDWVLIYGDTNSTLAGAVAAAKLHIPVAHVEAGLRSFNRRMPEEINRVIADQLSEVLLVPTETAAQNLMREGIASSRVHRVGDVMYDAALYFGSIAETKSSILRTLGLGAKTYILATVHRAENTDSPQRLLAIFEGLAEVAEKTPVVLPLHPRTRAILEKGEPALKHAASKLRIVDPVGYLDMIQLEKNARALATDSGGVQKEAFFFRVPCVTLRDETEWVELVELGWNRLAPPLSSKTIAQAIEESLDRRGKEAQPYGEGAAGKRILEILTQSPRPA